MTHPRPNNVSVAALWMLGGIVSFSLMAVSGREAGQFIETAELLTWRGLIGIAVIVVVLAVSGRFAEVRSARLPLHLARNIGHFFGQYCWYYAVTLIPLAQLFALEFTSPIWVALVAPFLLGERFTVVKALSITLSFIGVLMVVEVWAEGFVSEFSGGQVWGLLAAFGFAANMIATKRLTSTETTLCVLFWLVIMQTPMAFIVAGELPTIPPNGWIWMWVFSLSIAGLCAHFCLTQAFRHADATIVTPMDFARLPVIAVIGALVYAEPVLWNVLAGGGLIFLGNYLNMRFGAR